MREVTGCSSDTPTPSAAGGAHKQSEATRIPVEPAPPRLLCRPLTRSQARIEELFRQAIRNPHGLSVGAVELAQRVDALEDLLRQAAPHLDPMFRAQIEEVLG